jgi:hypothetical protein
MNGKKEPSPESVARVERQRMAREEGVQAMADLELQAVNVRKNMERLRGLRETKETEEARSQTAPSKAEKKRNERTLETKW